MQIKEISFKETGRYSDLIIDYIEQKEALKQFYKYPLNYDAIPLIIEEKKMQQLDRNLLVEVLKDQYANIPVNDAVNNNIQSLLSENTFTITTAHQLNIFTGPLYFHIKIISAINICKKLSELYPDFKFVPVYWMGSEDHDFDEINHINLFNKKVKWNAQPEGPVGRMDSRRMKKTIEELEEILGKSDTAAELIGLFKKAYLHHESMADATRYLVNELYKEYGLLVLDGDDKRLKQIFRPVMEDEFINKSSQRLVKEQADKLEKHYKVQAYSREINLFYMKDGFRERIVYNSENDDFEVLNTHLFFNEEALRDELEKCPENFSPNVILRPLHQEMVLPNLAYVGGGGEIAYWMELEKVFEYHKVNFPMLVVRNSIMWIDNNTDRKMSSLGMEIDDIFDDEDKLIKKHVKTQTNEELTLKKQKEQIEQIFNSIMEKAVEIDPTLEQPVKGEEQRVINSFEKLEAKLLKAEKRKFETDINQITAILHKLFPDDNLQERYENFIPFYLKYGKDFINELINNLQPIDQQFTIFIEE